MSTMLLSNQELYDAAEHELVNFFHIAAESTGKTYMPSCIVDELWHLKLDDNVKYAHFCNKTVGNYVLHQPSSGRGKLQWVERYELLYGKLSPLWFTNKEGFLDKDAYDNYLATGELVMEWDCVPVKACNAEVVKNKNKYIF